MIPYVRKTGDIDGDQVTLYHQVRQLIELLPNSPELDCHELVEIIEKRFSNTFNIVRGKFLGADHSWLEFKSNPKVILDVYPVAVGSGPILLTMQFFGWRVAYKDENGSI